MCARLATLADGTGMLATAQNPFLFPYTFPSGGVYGLSNTSLFTHIGYYPLQSWKQVVCVCVALSLGFVL